jgi:DNA-binding Xre family transcriptional regulator
MTTEGAAQPSNWATVGRKVKLRRARQSKTMTDVPGVSRTTMHRIERGQPISLELLGRIEAALGFAEGELVDIAFPGDDIPVRQRRAS